MRCTRGAIFDVAVDLRAGLADATARWHGVELRADNGRRLLHPGRASRTASRRSPTTPRSSTRCRRRTCPDAARGVRWDDPAFGIEWPAPPPGGRTMSERDAHVSRLRAVTPRPRHRRRPASSAARDARAAGTARLRGRARSARGRRPARRRARPQRRSPRRGRRTCCTSPGTPSTGASGPRRRTSRGSRRSLAAAARVRRGGRPPGGDRRAPARSTAGTASTGRCVEGATPLAPATLYGAAKHATHVAAQAFARQAG